MFFLGSERWLREVSKCPSQRYRESQRESPGGGVFGVDLGVSLKALLGLRDDDL